ncbi:MAG: BTAD domain-containing putative transcriptional regulator, partial [Gemmatimonadota bacterium]
MLQLRTFGRLELLAGEPAALHLLPAQPKPLALLSYLAVATPRGPHRRDALLALFWPELREEEARRALRQALHRLRYHVGDELLRTERDGQIGIVDQGAWCDAVAFEQALDAGHPAEALALYQGAFLDGIFVADVSPDFEQWVDLTRTRLAGRAAEAAGALAAEARRTGDQSAEMRWAAQASRLAPDAEPHLRALMAALTDQGDRTGALRAYQSFADRIAEDFGAVPVAETAALAQALRAGPSGTGPSTASPAPIRGAVHDSDSARLGHSHPKGRWPLALGIALGSAVLALIVYLGLNSSAAAPAIDGILVADFRNHTRDSLLAGAVAEALRVDLSQSRRTRVMSRGQVHAVLQRMQQPAGDLMSDEVVREVAERYGV